MSYSLDQNSTDYQHGSRGVEVFVGGLARSLNEDKVRKVFAACGEITDMRLIKDQNGILKGFGFVRFATKEAADKALKELSGSMLEGKKIGVLPSAAQDTLFLGNLNKGWSADDFNKVVRQVFPDVVSIDLAMPQSGSEATSKKFKNRGFAFVKFSSHATAARAFRAGSKPDFVLGGTLHPSVQWVEEDPEVDPDELAKIKIAFVRKLPSTIDEGYLKKLFMPFGKVEKVVVSSKGDSSVGFVHFSQRSHLDNAIEGLNEKIVPGPKGGPSIKIQVEVARPMDKKRKRVHEDFQNTQPRDNLNKPRPQNHDPYLNSFDGHEETLQKEAVVDPHEAAVLLLPVAVRERLLRILRLGIATRFDIEVESLSNLAELPESMAISVLDQFMLSGAEKHDKGGYLAALISRYQVDKFGANQQPSSLSRLREPVRAHLPSVDSLPYVDPSRGDSYTSRYSTLYSDYRLPSRPGMVKTEDRSPIQLHELPGSSSSSSYGKYLVNSHIPTAYGNMEEMSPVQSHQIPGPSFAKPSQDPYSRIPGPIPTLSFSKSGPSPDPQINDRPGSRPQMRFDPFTGQPYKFDPFTGEPIVPESLARRYDSPY
ncbi:uncharacterized protein LOC111920081 isoform X2 [Lactuca sativa]|uniref:uncharacterized protein LOC111920081 isoform X2 n=1 Tax=Lactuca sativa TaxID=4236 RepID=UPI001C688446|nr:uncharacterized protein LOC111920081 isoform X2 [Lactuca sativa]